MEICSGISTECLFILLFQVELEIRNVGFCGGRKTGEPGEKPSEQGQQPTRNSTHMWCQLRDSNPGHINWWEASIDTQSKEISILTFLIQMEFFPKDTSSSREFGRIHK